MFTDSPLRPGTDPNAGTVNRIPVTPQARQEFFLSPRPSPVLPSMTAAKPGSPESLAEEAPAPSCTPGASTPGQPSSHHVGFGWVSWHCTAAMGSGSNKFPRQA